ncbi:Guanine nucleotide-binding protein subunit beta-like protein [Frankliniella fusca]|uniref:Guanine nucleotide-binding protein subunit beta-like protein n=1 Tax=Frankliniella fusca TaxID=407009 RepID=A0AAE1HHU7_9NEOP|nr:Guanine nucleotide-binding protein subunit beta-like protein [Frankliniella fusca]
MGPRQTRTSCWKQPECTECKSKEEEGLVSEQRRGRGPGKHQQDTQQKSRKLLKYSLCGKWGPRFGRPRRRKNGQEKRVLWTDGTTAVNGSAAGGRLTPSGADRRVRPGRNNTAKFDQSRG